MREKFNVLANFVKNLENEKVLQYVKKIFVHFNTTIQILIYHLTKVHYVKEIINLARAFSCLENYLLFVQMF